MTVFLENSSNVQKSLNALHEDSYKELYKKYSCGFQDYDDNFDTILAKQEQDEFYKKINILYSKIKSFRVFILQEIEKFSEVQLYRNYEYFFNI